MPIKYLLAVNGHVGIGLSFFWFMSCGFALIKDSLVLLMKRQVMILSAIIFVFLALVRYKISMNAYDILA